MASALLRATRRQLFVWIAMTMLVLAPIAVCADPIAVSRPVGGGVGEFLPNTGEGVFTLRAFPGGIDLFGIPVTVADIGRTFSTDAATDADFGPFAAILTNGRSDTLEFDFGAASGGKPIGVQIAFGSSERGFFDLPARVEDFLGFTLTGLAFHVDDFSSVSRPDIGDPFTIFNLRGSISVLGSRGPETSPTPEPAALMLFGTGFVGLVARTCTSRPRSRAKAHACFIEDFDRVETASGMRPAREPTAEV